MPTADKLTKCIKCGVNLKKRKYKRVANGRSRRTWEQLYKNICVDCNSKINRDGVDRYNKRHPGRGALHSQNKRLKAEGMDPITAEEWDIILERKEEYTRLTGKQFRGRNRTVLDLLNDEFWECLLDEILN